MPGNFFDTNVLLYVASEDSAQADRAEKLVGAGGIISVISVQVLNEIANMQDGVVLDDRLRTFNPFRAT